jgi:hypothetical protein
VNVNSVILVFKFKQIFKKIGQAKALYLSYVFPQIFTLLLSYLNGESELSGCRTIATLPFKDEATYTISSRFYWVTYLFMSIS